MKAYLRGFAETDPTPAPVSLTLVHSGTPLIVSKMRQAVSGDG